MMRGRQSGGPAAWTSRIVVGLAVLDTFLAVLATVPSTRSWPSAAAVAVLVVLPAALCASVLAWIAWRLSPLPDTAWFTAAAAMVGVQWPLLLLHREHELAAVGIVSSTVVLGLALLLIVWIANRADLRVPPVPVGIGLGLLLLLVPIGRARTAIGDEIAASSRLLDDAVGVTALMMIGALVAFAIVRQSSLPIPVIRLATAVLLWSWSAALATTDLVEHPVWAAVAVAGGLGAATLVIGAAADLVLLSMGDRAATVRALERELSTLRDQTRADIEQLHEVKGTIAGLASASALIQDERRLPADQRERLTEMLTAETARLHRMFDDRPPASASPTADLDDIIRPLVVSHRVQGEDVVWHAPPEPIHAPADPLAEVVNILLHNASEHAPGAPVWIYTRAADQGAARELVVVDLGPGISEAHREDVFRWGWRGHRSRGRGVGLAIAAGVLETTGGSLRLDPRRRRGTCFVIELPPDPRRAEDPDRLADNEALRSC